MVVEGTGIVLSLIGAAKTIWELKDKFQKTSKKARLTIEKIYIANVVFQPNLELRRFVIAKVRNTGETLAERCMGYLSSKQTP